VYLGWANRVFVPFFPFSRINNLRIFNVAFSWIPTAPTNYPICSEWLSVFARRQKAAIRKSLKGGTCGSGKINSSLGALGSSEFFQNFYMHIARHGSRRLIPGMILAGPLMWLLGAGSFWSNRSGWTRMANTAMTFAATVWAVTFVFDGFVAPDIVRWMTPETGLYQLAVNQDAVIRLGLVSWLMLGFSIIAGSVGILVSSPSRSAKVLAWIGLPLGAWPFNA
jgi:hypothetical protein